MHDAMEHKAADPTRDEEHAQEERMRPTIKNIIKHEGELIDRELKGYRNAIIGKLPSFIVNNSSNAIAGTQLVAEVMMFKANNMDLVKKEHRNLGNWWRYLTDPPTSILKSVTQSAGVSFKPRDLLRPGFYKDTAKGFVDLDHATKVDSVNGARLINRWQARSSFMGLTTMLITALVPDAKDNPEDVQKDAMLAQSNPIAYMGKRVFQAVTFPITVVSVVAQKILTLGKFEAKEEVGEHKRQFTGLGLLITGVFSFLSGFRNVSMVNPALGKEAVGNLKYVKNSAHSIGGLITAAAGAQLMLALDNDSGWSRFGATQWLRMAFLPKSIANRYENHDPKANWYVAGQVGMQTANTLSYYIGGAEKLPDGTVVDHTQMRDEARRAAKQAKEDRKAGKIKHVDAKAANDDIAHANDEHPTTPESKISHASKAEIAMPERRAAKEQEAATAHA